MAYPFRVKRMYCVQNNTYTIVQGPFGDDYFQRLKLIKRRHDDVCIYSHCLRVQWYVPSGKE